MRKEHFVFLFFFNSDFEHLHVLIISDFFLDFLFVFSSIMFSAPVTAIKILQHPRICLAGTFVI